MTDTVRWGILGAGSMAMRFARDLSHTRKGQFVAVASRNPTRAQQLVSAAGIAHHGARAIENYAALVSDPNVDAIYIATPTAMHREHALLAIAAGKPVLCEKPLAGGLADARAVADAAQSAGVFCMEALWSRFLPAFRELERRIETLGPLRHIEATLGFARVERAGDPVTDQRLGGGALNDLGVYPLALATALIGKMELMSCDVRRSADLGETVRDAALLLKSESGVAINISTSHTTVLSNRLVIAGDNGRITIDAPFIEALGFRHLPVMPVDHRAGDGSGRATIALKMSALWPILRKLSKPMRHPDGRHVSYDYRGTGLQFQAEEVQRCLSLGLHESPLLPLAASIHVQDLITKVKQFDTA